MRGGQVGFDEEALGRFAEARDEAAQEWTYFWSTYKLSPDQFSDIVNRKWLR
ncbi:hypothetical protein [Streptomyces sp. NRRL S-237]|uniref:hypothetical protein n=1 Tax=Streptomyces sp. NRRL S-237 TaxID=1463895 RepID=UPI00131D8F14|nr:hypothetical protein [Streptomyces sp. NRRL S-237]